MEIGRAHFELLKIRLRALRPLLSSAPGAKRYSDLFDEFLTVGEFGLALETLCDCLLEPEAPPIGGVELLQIEKLHTLMASDDSCVARLRDKCRAESK
jgi:hypothetical protein